MKISKSKACLYFLLFPCFATLYLNVDDNFFDLISHLIAFWQIVSFTIVSVYFLSRRKKTNHNEARNAFLLFLLILLISMIYNSNTIKNIIRFLRLYIPILTFWMLSDIYMVQGSKIILEVLYRLSNLLILLNGILMLLYPNGIFQAYTERIDILDWKLYQRCNLLGVDNRLIIVFICGIIFSEIYNSIVKKQTFAKWGFYGVILAQEIFIWSATGIVSIVILLALIIIINMSFTNFKKYFINYQNAILLYIGLFLILCVFNLTKIWEPFITNILGKDITLTNRTYIWSSCINMIFQKPFIGFGNCDTRTFIEFNGYIWYAHNLFFDIMLQGGALALGAFALFIIKCNRKSISKLDKICVAGIFSMLIVNIAESFIDSIYFFVPFIIYLYIKNYTLE